MAAAHAKIVHQVPGRIRIQVPGAKRRPGLLNEIKKSISAAEGVGEIEVHPTTSSVIVHYRRDPAHPGHFRDKLTQQGHSSGLFDLAPPDISEGAEMENKLAKEADFLASRSELAKKVVDATRELNGVIKRVSDNTLDLNVLVPGGLAVYAFLYLGAELSTPLWVTLGIFSFNSFVALHPPLQESHTAGAPGVQHTQKGQNPA